MALAKPYIQRALRFSPTIFERLVAEIPTSALDERPDPDRFTIRESLCHLADWDPIFLERLQGAVEVENFSIVPCDEGQLAIDHDYAHQDVDEVLRRFRAGREAYATYVESLSSEALGRSATHPEQGRLTASDLISMVVGHDVYHIEQISAFLGRQR